MTAREHEAWLVSVYPAIWPKGFPVIAVAHELANGSARIAGLRGRPTDVFGDSLDYFAVRVHVREGQDERAPGPRGRNVTGSRLYGLSPISLDRDADGVGWRESCVVVAGGTQGRGRYILIRNRLPATIRQGDARQQEHASNSCRYDDRKLTHTNPYRYDDRTSWCNRSDDCTSLCSEATNSEKEDIVLFHSSYYSPGFLLRVWIAAGWPLRDACRAHRPDSATVLMAVGAVR